jgi:hypothetical protein
LPTPSPTTTAGFYLRAWYDQALPPAATFGQLPMLTISDGLLLDGNVAIPAIYPGPIFIRPFARAISGDGQLMIADEARRLGLLGEEGDFTGGAVAPGAQIARLLLVVDGLSFDLSGRPDFATGCSLRSCQAEPGSAEAFTTFWQEISMLDVWLNSDLGPSEHYEPDRIAVLFTLPTRSEPGLQQRPLTWPLPGSFEQMGSEFPGVEGSRCVTLAGEDAASVIPVLDLANQLTVLHDEVDGQRAATAVVIVPGAESPC